MRKKGYENKDNGDAPDNRSGGVSGSNVVRLSDHSTTANVRLCGRCAGSGYVSTARGDDFADCPICLGSGKVVVRS